MELQKALDLLGVEPPPLRGCRNVGEAQKLLSEWKSGPLKSAYKAAVRATHPDFGSEADQAARNAATARVIDAYESIRDTLQVVSRRPAPMRRGFGPTRVVVVNSGWSQSATTTSSTTGGTWKWHS